MNKNTNAKGTGTEFIEALIDIYNSLNQEDKKQVNIIAAEVYLDYANEQEKKQETEKRNTVEGINSNTMPRGRSSSLSANRRNTLASSNKTTLDNSTSENKMQQGQQGDVVRRTSLLSSSLKSLAKIAGLK